MAFAHSKQSRVYVNGYALSHLLKTAAFSATADPADVTSLLDQSVAWLPGFEEGSVTLEGMSETNEDAAFEVLSDAFNLPGTLLTYLPYGDAVSNHGSCVSAIEASYEVNSTVGDMVTTSAELTPGVGGIEFSRVLHALQLRDVNGNGAALNNLVPTAAGGAGYLHVTDVTGAGNLVVKIQDSADNLVWADIITFATVTADHKSERKTVAGAVRQYVRATWNIGALDDATFHVSFARK